MAINERAMNIDIARIMEAQAPRNYKVVAEDEGQLLMSRGAPDIVVRMPYGLRTVVETEYGDPAVGDAIKRLGRQFRDDDMPMRSVIALGIPEWMGDLGHGDRAKALMSEEPRFLMQVVTGESPNDPGITVVPDKPILVSLRDVVQYAWLAAVPEPYAKIVTDEAIKGMTAAQDRLAKRFNQYSARAQGRLVRKYGRHASAKRIESAAGNIVGTLFSMIQLHMNLKKWGGLEDALAIDAPELWAPVYNRDGLPRRIAEEWRKIEAIDYMPLSTIAAGMLEDSDVSPHIGATLKSVRNAAERYIATSASATTNVAAEVWQSLIPDRDERAAYYTKPAVAEFVANMATARLASPKDAAYNEICAGTGTLSRATEENLRFRHYAQTEDKASVHAYRMQNRVQLTDINPQSISVATVNMISLEPETPLDGNAMFAITADGGSLNFLLPSGVSNMEDRLTGSAGSRAAMMTLVPLSVGVCCNNDPYFRARGGASNPIDSADMSRYRNAANRRVPGVASGDAGLDTFMHVVEHEMLSYGAPHGKVLPLTAAHAHSYEGFRKNIENEYRDVVAVCVAAGGGESMSADTGIQEMLLIGAKHTPTPEKPLNGDRAVVCVNLARTFQTRLEAKMFADAIHREIALGKKLGEIVVGDSVGAYYRLDNLGDGKPWHTLGAGGDYAKLTDMLTNGLAWNQSTGAITEFALPMTTLSGVSGKGPTHHLLGCIPASRDARGAFTMRPADQARNRLNPSLWVLDAKTQLTITCEPTHYGEPRSTPEDARRMLQTAGHFHLSRNLRTSAQTIAIAYAETECMGDRSWTTIKANDGAPDGVMEAIALFMNSVYGMIVRTGYGQSTDLGRSVIQVRAIDGHPVPDFTGGGDAAKSARATALKEFGRLRQLPLKRVSLCAIDASREEIDRVVTMMLGIPWNMETEGMLASWRREMCLQPIVHANNKATLAALCRAGITA